ncbi:hypothetical protein G6F40_016581 [Rhizopus arrhizus]|nr:hypothetical protein G6F40_016581 [Rhizopus arrhizus]
MDAPIEPPWMGLRRVLARVSQRRPAISIEAPAHQPANAFHSGASWSIRIRLANNENASMPASPFARLTQCGSQRGGFSTPLSNSGANAIASVRLILPANNQRQTCSRSSASIWRKKVCTDTRPRRYTVSLVKARPPLGGTPRNTRCAEAKLSSVFCPASQK